MKKGNLKLNITKEEFLKMWDVVEDAMMDNIDGPEELADILVENGVIKE